MAKEIVSLTLSPDVAARLRSESRSLAMSCSGIAEKSLREHFGLPPRNAWDEKNGQ